MVERSHSGGRHRRGVRPSSTKSTKNSWAAAAAPCHLHALPARHRRAKKKARSFHRRAGDGRTARASSSTRPKIRLHAQKALAGLALDLTDLGCAGLGRGRSLVNVRRWPNLHPAEGRKRPAARSSRLIGPRRRPGSQEGAGLLLSSKAYRSEPKQTISRDIKELGRWKVPPPPLRAGPGNPVQIRGTQPSGRCSSSRQAPHHRELVDPACAAGVKPDRCWRTPPGPGAMMVARQIDSADWARSTRPTARAANDHGNRGSSRSGKSLPMLMRSASKEHARPARRKPLLSLRSHWEKKISNMQDRFLAYFQAGPRGHVGVLLKQLHRKPWHGPFIAMTAKPVSESDMGRRGDGLATRTRSESRAAKKSHRPRRERKTQCVGFDPVRRAFIEKRYDYRHWPPNGRAYQAPYPLSAALSRPADRPTAWWKSPEKYGYTAGFRRTAAPGKRQRFRSGFEVGSAAGEAHRTSPRFAARWRDKPLSRPDADRFYAQKHNVPDFDAHTPPPKPYSVMPTCGTPIRSRRARDGPVGKTRRPKMPTRGSVQPGRAAGGRQARVRDSVRNGPGVPPMKRRGPAATFLFKPQQTRRAGENGRFVGRLDMI